MRFFKKKRGELSYHSRNRAEWTFVDQSYIDNVVRKVERVKAVLLSKQMDDGASKPLEAFTKEFTLYDSEGLEPMQFLLEARYREVNSFSLNEGVTTAQCAADHTR